MDEPNDIQATGRCYCAGCIGMGPCDLHDQDDTDDDRDPGICWCRGDCTCGWDEYDEAYDTSPWDLPEVPPWPTPVVTVAPSEAYL